MPKLTQKRFELFNRTIIKCLNLLGLGEWYVSVGKRKLKNADAQMSHDATARRAYLLINSNDSHESDYDIENSACHEVAELLLADLTDLRDKNIPIAQYDKVRHSVIQRIARLLQYTMELENNKLTKKKKQL